MKGRKPTGESPGWPTEPRGFSSSGQLWFSVGWAENCSQMCTQLMPSKTKLGIQTLLSQAKQLLHRSCSCSSLLSHFLFSQPSVNPSVHHSLQCPQGFKASLSDSQDQRGHQRTAFGWLPGLPTQACDINCILAGKLTAEDGWCSKHGHGDPKRENKTPTC